MDELRAYAMKAQPRYGVEMGVCPLCSFGATLVDRVAGLWWCRCRPCQTRWPSAMQDFRPWRLDFADDDEPVPVEFDAIYADLIYQTMLELSECVQLEPRARQASAEEASRPGGHMISSEELRSRSLADFEVRAFAAQLGWPGIEWSDPDGRRFSIPAGQWAWRDSPLGGPAKRRLVYMALVELEHRIVPISHNTRREKS